MRHDSFLLPAMIVVTAALFAANLLVGAVQIPAIDVWHILCGDDSVKHSWQYIVLESRIPQAVTAMLCGASLAVSGLMLQTALHSLAFSPFFLLLSWGQWWCCY